jgi:2-polyprenyl-3-methyl-5-hydroxy-6-metoxy-1,4-benzoquinol methylase
MRTLRKRDKKILEKHSGPLSVSSHDPEQHIHLIDKEYFDGYSKIQIHHEMCSDKRRLDAYEAALKEICKDKIVVDVGAGTGVLSFFAHEAGAARVYAIENAGIATKLRAEVSKRRLKKSIKVMHCTAEEAPLNEG